jgi:hypothetical protein
MPLSPRGTVENETRLRLWGVKPGQEYYWSSPPLSFGEMTTKAPLP